MGHTKCTNVSFLTVVDRARVEIGRQRQRGEGPRISVLMDINNLEIRSLFTKLSLGITLVDRVGQVPNPHLRRREQQG